MNDTPPAESIWDEEIKRWGTKVQTLSLLTDQVILAATHAGVDPSMLAWALPSYSKHHRLNEDALARWLKISRDELATLALQRAAGCATAQLGRRHCAHCQRNRMQS
jgi:hypothetical protein